MPAIVYCTVGTNDLERAREFYDALFSAVGVEGGMELPRGRLYRLGGTSFAVLRPFDGERATAGNGAMCSFGFESPAEVDAFHAAALRLGGACEGPPGERVSGSYIAYVRDLDGNKLAALCARSA